MADYKDPRPSPTASAADPCVIYDNAVSFNEVVNGDTTVTTYTGIELKPLPLIVSDTESVADYLIDTLSNSFGIIYKGDFADGFTINSRNEAGFDGADLWVYNLAIPELGLVVSAGFTPSTPNWTKITFASAYNVNWQGGKTIGYNADDWKGFTESLYADTGTVDNGIPDTAIASQRLDAMKALNKRDNSISLASAVSEDSKVGTSYVISDLGFAQYTVVAAGDTGGFYIATMSSGRKLRLIFDSIVKAAWVYDGNDLNPSISAVTLLGASVDICGGTFSIKSTATWHKTVFDSTGNGALNIDFNSNPFANIYGDGVQPNGFTVDFKERDSVRGIRVHENAKASYPYNLRILNTASLTFHRSIEISDQGCTGIDVNNIKGFNLKAVANGIIGDNNGSCRLVFVGGFAGTVTNPSEGRIYNISGDTILPSEDADMVHVISSYAGDVIIDIQNCYGVDVGKRIVKVQANGVNVRDCDAKQRSVTTVMNSVVSHYGERGSVHGVTGSGNILYGVDCYKAGTSVSRIDLMTTAANGAGLLAQSSGDYSDIKCTGGSNVAWVRAVLEDIQDISIDCLRGSSTKEAIKISLEGYSIGSLKLSNANTVSGDGFRGAVFTRTASEEIAKLTMDTIDARISGYFTGLDIRYCKEVKLSNISPCGASSVEVNVLGATKVNSSDILCSDNAAVTLYLQNCSNTISESIQSNMAALWKTGTYKSIGDVVISTGRRYVSTTAGTTGVSAPVHGAGSVSDGGVTWLAGSLINAITLNSGDKHIANSTYSQFGTTDVSSVSSPTNVVIANTIKFTNI